MSYVDQKSGPSPTGLASALIVQGAIGALMVTGLSVVTGAVEEPEILSTLEFKDPPPPPPEKAPEPKPDAQPREATQPPRTVPQPKMPLSDNTADYETVETVYDGPIVLKPLPPVQLPPAPPAPVPSFDPVSAKPRNDPGSWLRERDYKSSWVRREYTGLAGFRLDIAATGKVTGCRITSSTGHAELDDATCALIQQRARFEPARGSNGEPVAGSYASSVRWVLPE